ncbi:MAG: hypothetical protein WDW38_005126 [Sanguina aurantia]
MASPGRGLVGGCWGRWTIWGAGPRESGIFLPVITLSNLFTCDFGVAYFSALSPQLPLSTPDPDPRLRLRPTHDHAEASPCARIASLNLTVTAGTLAAPSPSLTPSPCAYASAPHPRTPGPIGAHTLATRSL